MGGVWDVAGDEYYWAIWRAVRHGWTVLSQSRSLAVLCRGERTIQVRRGE